jgi:iron complex outermembrane receptor protein
VVTSEEIKRYGYRTLADVLRSVPGFYTSYDRNNEFLGTRGLSLGDFNSRILLLVDGHRINNNLTDGAYIGTEFILDIDLIERVEIIHGPGSVLYGNNAVFGVINVITREGRKVSGVEVAGEYGSFDTYKARLTYGKLFDNGVRLMLSGTYYHSDGQDRLFYEEFNTPAQNNGIAQNIDGGYYVSSFGSLGFKDFTLEGAYIYREKTNPTAQYFTTFNDPRLVTIDQQGYAALRYVHSFDEVVDVAARVYYDRSDFNITYPFGTALFEQQDSGEWWGAELQFNKRILDRHILTLGAEYRDDFRQSSKVFDAVTTYSDIHTNQQTYGVYFQGDFAVLTNLHATLGVRYDQVGGNDPEFNPRVALIYNPVPASTLKAIYGSAFRSPNFSELIDPRFQNIKPEDINSYEFVYEQGIGRNLRSSLAAYFNQMDDLIVLENGAFTNFNAQTAGFELALQGFWTNGIRTTLSYSFQQTENLTTSGDVPDSPEHMVKLNLSVPVFREKIFAGLEYQYTSSRATVQTTTTGVTLPGEEADGYSVVNLTVYSRDLVKNLEFSASVYNLLNTTYFYPASRFHLQDMIQSDGRSFRLKLSYRF